MNLLNYPATPLPLFVQSPINLIKQEGDTVTFNVSNPFGDNIQAIYYQFYEGEDVKCLAKTNLVACTKPVTVKATCRAGRDASHKETLKFTTVEIWVVDAESVSEADQFTIPPCCHPDVKHSEINTVMYRYKVYCQTSCPVATAARRLRTLP